MQLYKQQKYNKLSEALRLHLHNYYLEERIKQDI